MSIVRIGHARIDENGKAVGGVAGDQNGKEVCVSEWYWHSKGWVVLRCKDPERRKKIAEAMERACANDQIGYDQNHRHTLYNNVKLLGFDPSNTTKNVETDCSALVRVCIAFAYGKDITGDFSTSSEPSALVNTGEFEKLTDERYCSYCEWLLRGDVICTREKGHTAVVLDDGELAHYVPDEKPAESDLSVKVRKLSKGCKGDDVKALQILLIGRGFSCGRYGDDGDFGSATDKAVKAYQTKKCILPDGVVCEETWAALLGVEC